MSLNQSIDPQSIQVQKQLKIKTGTLERSIKDLCNYELEYTKQQERIERLKSEGKRLLKLGWLQLHSIVSLF